MIKFPSLDEFQKSLDRDPNDWETRLVYADLLEELGEPVLANGQRWQVENRKRPRPIRNHWFWLPDINSFSHRSALDIDILISIAASDLVQIDKGSVRLEERMLAENVLAIALEKLQIVSTCNSLVQSGVDDGA